MSVRFTLEKRTNKFGECPIRLSWSFGGQRYQTTMGFSIMETDWDEMKRRVKSGSHNYKGQTTDDINYYIKRISLVVTGVERHFVRNEKGLTKARMKQAVSDVLSDAIARPEDVIERCLEGKEPIREPEPMYYRDRQGQFYRFLCEARCEFITYKILQQLFGEGERIAVPSTYFESLNIKGEKKEKPDYEMVKYEVVFGRHR